jgi:hypothetical protein
MKKTFEIMCQNLKTDLIKDHDFVKFGKILNESRENFL